MGRKRLEELTETDIRHYKREIEGYKKKQKLFLILGFVFLGLFILSVVGTILLGIGVYQEIVREEFTAAYFLYVVFDSIFITLSILFLIAFITLFVLRSALFGRKIENRLVVIEDYEELHKTDNK